jgi:hypothetical protein
MNQDINLKHFKKNLIGDQDSWVLLPVLAFEQSLCELAARSLVL